MAAIASHNSPAHKVRSSYPYHHRRRPHRAPYFRHPDQQDPCRRKKKIGWLVTRMDPRCRSGSGHASSGPSSPHKRYSAVVAPEQSGPGHPASAASAPGPAVRSSSSAPAVAWVGVASSAFAFASFAVDPAAFANCKSTGCSSDSQHRSSEWTTACCSVHIPDVAYNSSVVAACMGAAAVAAAAYTGDVASCSACNPDFFA